MRKRPNKKRFDGRTPPPRKKFGRKPEMDSLSKGEPIDMEGMRFNKYVAHCGIASRREAAELIKEGLFKVNDVVVKEPGHKLQKNDKVTYKGKEISIEEEQVYLLLNKPKDTITTNKDERGRRTVLDLIGEEITQRIFPVGRLDRATTGLLLLTNDGDLAQKLAHPRYNIKKVYQVVLDKSVTIEHLDEIKAGLTLEDGKAPVDAVGYVNGKSKNEVGIEIHIGRNRIVRRIFEHLGYEVKRLDRMYYAGLTKRDLPRGHYRHLSRQEVIMLKHFSSPKK